MAFACCMKVYMVSVHMGKHVRRT